MLTLWGRVTYLCSFDLYHHWLRQWLVLCAALPNSHRILFQHHTRSSLEASQALSWRSICWHQSMWTIEELSSLPRTHFRTRPGSSSELAQIIFWVCPGSHSMLPQDPLPTSKNPSICMLTDLLPSNNMLLWSQKTCKQTKIVKFSHFMFDHKGQLWQDSIQRLLHISTKFFFVIKIHIVLFKTVPGLVDTPRR